MAEPQSNSGRSGCIVAAVVIGVLVIIGKCSAPKESKTAQSFASPTLTDQIDAMASPAPAPIAELSAASIRTARQHLTTVARAEGLSGAMIYSQNCYDALSRTFSWAKLDLCGGFDLLATSTLDTTDTTGLSAELAYFEPEAAAGRYLAVATKAGEAAEEADTRLEKLQARTLALQPPTLGADPTPAATETPGGDLAPSIDNIIMVHGPDE